MFLINFYIFLNFTLQNLLTLVFNNISKFNFFICHLVIIFLIYKSVQSQTDNGVNVTRCSSLAGMNVCLCSLGSFLFLKFFNKKYYKFSLKIIKRRPLSTSKKSFIHKKIKIAIFFVLNYCFSAKLAISFIL
jgi:hypothetical protein